MINLVAILLIVVLNFVLELDKTFLWGQRIKVWIVWGGGHKILKKYFIIFLAFSHFQSCEINSEILSFDFNQREKILEMQKVGKVYTFWGGHKFGDRL